MKHILSSLLILIVLLTQGGLEPAWAATEHYFKVHVASLADNTHIQEIISIDRIEGTSVYAYAAGKSWDAFLDTGIPYTEVPHPGTLYEATMWSEKDGEYDFTTYPSYDQYTALMHSFPTKYPNAAGVSELHTIGTTVLGRDLLAIRISDNLSIDENEPEILLTSSIHGDETTGLVLALRMIDSLLSAYGADTLVTRLVDSCDIWVCPLLNPDGTYRDDSSVIDNPHRTNENGVDLNRNYPDLLKGESMSQRQPETQAMIDLASAHSFVLAANLHGGIELIAFPWMTTDQVPDDPWDPDFSHPDSVWFDRVSRSYVDTAWMYAPPGYMTGGEDGIIQGNWLYPAPWTASDYRVFRHGCREVTPEISGVKFLPEAELAAHWQYNRASLFNFVEEALYGIRGRVTTTVGDHPLAATVKVIGHDTDRDSSRVFTDPDAGDYHRYIAPGTYDLKFLAPGFVPEVRSGIGVQDLSTVWLDVTMDICGDADGDLSVTMADIGYLQDYIFYGGPPPVDMESADATCDGSVNIGDVVYLINYLVKGGPAPCAWCE